MTPKLSRRQLLHWRFYPFYRHFSGIAHRWSGLLTPAGWFVLGGMTLAGIFGLDTNRSTAYQIFGFLFAVCVTGMVMAPIFRGRARVRRLRLPRFASPGVPLRYRVLVEILPPRRCAGLTLQESLPDPRPTREQFVRCPEPGEERRNGFDRLFVAYRWMWLVERARMAEAPERTDIEIPPSGRTEVEMTLTPLRRGVLRLPELQVRRTEPFGLFRAHVRTETPDGEETVTILPRRHPIPHLALPGSSRHQPGGVSLASAVGASEEFVALRDYRPGDPLRHIHWRSWAKAGKPVVKEHQDEFFARYGLLLDTFAVPGQEDLFEQAVSVAASFACRLEDNDSLLDLLFVGTKAFNVTAGRGVGQTSHILEILSAVQPQPSGVFDDLKGLAVQHSSGLSCCVAVLLQWDDMRRELAGHLAALGVPVLAIVILPSGAPVPPVGVAGVEVKFIHEDKVAEGLACLGARV